MENLVEVIKLEKSKKINNDFYVLIDVNSNFETYSLTIINQIKEIKSYNKTLIKKINDLIIYYYNIIKEKKYFIFDIKNKEQYKFLYFYFLDKIINQNKTSEVPNFTNINDLMVYMFDFYINGFIEKIKTLEDLKEKPILFSKNYFEKYEVFILKIICDINNLDISLKEKLIDSLDFLNSSEFKNTLKRPSILDINECKKLVISL